MSMRASYDREGIRVDEPDIVFDFAEESEEEGGEADDMEALSELAEVFDDEDGIRVKCIEVDPLLAFLDAKEQEAMNAKCMSNQTRHWRVKFLGWVREYVQKARKQYVEPEGTMKKKVQTVMDCAVEPMMIGSMIGRDKYRCRRCKTEVKKGDFFCRHCGAEFIDM